MNIRYISNLGSGRCDDLEVPDGLTVAGVVRHLEPGNTEPLLYRVNRASCDPDRVVVDGDRVTVSYNKVQA